MQDIISALAIYALMSTVLTQQLRKIAMTEQISLILVIVAVSAQSKHAMLRHHLIASLIASTGKIYAAIATARATI